MQKIRGKSQKTKSEGPPPHPLYGNMDIPHENLVLNDSKMKINK